MQLSVVVVDHQGNVTVSLQGGNDLENWTVIDSMAAISSPGYATKKFRDGSGIAYRYVRVKYEVAIGVSNYAVLAAGINVANL